MEVDRVKISHIQKFFVNYMNNDSLGQIAHAHLATADMSPMGAQDGRCIRLAQLHSRAVGKFIEMARKEKETNIYLSIRFPKDWQTCHS